MSQRIIVKGQDKTDKIEVLYVDGHYVRIKFLNSSKTYTYRADTVKIIESDQNDEAVKVLSYFNDFVKAELVAGEQITAEASEDSQSTKPYTYVSMALEQLIKNPAIDNTVLSDVIARRSRSIDSLGSSPLIFPFGCNQSQKTAVEQALTHSLSVIQGPPGTGKTQTILNIIANLIVRGQSIAVVSNNNSATKNVQKKLADEKYGLGWLVAELGNRQNIERFFESVPQITLKPEWATMLMQPSKIKVLAVEVEQYFQNERCYQENLEALHTLELQKTVFLEEELKKGNHISESAWYRSLFSGKTVDGLNRCEQWIQNLMATDHWANSLWYKTLLWVYGVRDFSKLNEECDEALSAIVLARCDAKMTELKEINRKLMAWMDTHKSVQCDFVALSKQYLFAYLYRTFHDFSDKDLVKESFRSSHIFTKRFPVITSSTYALTNCTNTENLFDYLIIDEASQVNLPTAALCFHCARHAVVVGDSQQLEKIVSSQALEPSEEISPSFNAKKYSALDSLVVGIGEQLPQTLLQEHYRCHPDIIGFCNKRFYGGKLVTMTKRQSGNVPFEWIETPPNAVTYKNGSVLNERQYKETLETIEYLVEEGVQEEEIGVISPYRAQTRLFKDKVVESDTVHRFQGREKDTIIFCPVRNKAMSFNDNPHLINVAVSRAKKRFILISNDFAEQSDSNLSALVRYIRYLDPNLRKISVSKYRSVFDALYKQSQRIETRTGESPAEALFRRLLIALREDTKFGAWNFIQEYPLRLLPKSFQDFSAEQIRYMQNGSRLDFLLYDTIDTQPIAAIEVDGAAFHKAGSRQAERDQLKNEILSVLGIPTFRFKTNSAQGGEVEELKAFLETVYDTRNHP